MIEPSNYLIAIAYEIC